MNNEVQRDEITVNVARGLTAIARNFVRTIPHGDEIWDKGLGNVTQAFIEKHPSVPAGELTLEQFAQHIGVLPKEKKGRK